MHWFYIGLCDNAKNYHDFNNYIYVYALRYNTRVIVNSELLFTIVILIITYTSFVEFLVTAIEPVIVMILF